MKSPLFIPIHCHVIYMWAPHLYFEMIYDLLVVGNLASLDRRNTRLNSVLTDRLYRMNCAGKFSVVVLTTSQVVLTTSQVVLTGTSVSKTP